MDQRPHHIKLGYCDENPRTIWREYSKGNNDMRLPRILGKSRKFLKFMNTTIQKYLSTSDLHAMVLDISNAEEHKSKEDDSSECSANKEVIENYVNIAEDAQIEKINMME